VIHDPRYAIEGNFGQDVLREISLFAIRRNVHYNAPSPYFSFHREISVSPLPPIHLKNLKL